MKNNILKLFIVFVLGLVSMFALLSFTNENVKEPAFTKIGNDTAHAFVKIPKITKFYTKGELDKMQKLELIDIYKSRLAYLIETLPFLSLHPEPGATFKDMSIPETEINIAHLDKEAKNREDFIRSLNETLDDVIPYSEKTNIVWSILYFEEMIKKANYTEK
ncbi:MAG: hypothetical protein ACTHJT_08855 [Cytophaga sp.]|uniref:hypothetical protein n=1 Tax=Cytophaga sp. TaxID=29535 RepID=UPI003F80F740